MYGVQEVRDKSGPMQVDDPDPTYRLAQFALPVEEEGPLRKRPHSEIASPTRPFQLDPSSSRPPMHFGSNVPFLFELSKAPPLPPTPSFKRYNPAEWASTTFGFDAGPSASAGTPRKGLEDVDMNAGDSPARPTAEPVKGTVGTESGEERPIATGAVTRTRKKRQNEWRRRRRGSESAGESEAGPPRRDVDRDRGPSKSEHHYSFHMPAPAMRHSEIPHLLLGYLQFFVNAAVVAFCLYLAVQFVLTVRRDVQDRMQEYSVEILQEIAECSHLYLTNRCDPSVRVPAMHAACKAWEACMNRDSTIVGRTNVVAETFAGVINSFVDPISWKTMGFTLVTLSFLMILANSALFNLRSRTRHDPIEPQHGGLNPAHFIHPSHQHQQQYIGNNAYPYFQPDQGAKSTDSQAQIGWAGETKKKGWW